MSSNLWWCYLGMNSCRYYPQTAPVTGLLLPEVNIICVVLFYVYVYLVLHLLCYWPSLDWIRMVSHRLWSFYRHVQIYDLQLNDRFWIPCGTKYQKKITMGLCCLTVLICNATKHVTSQVSNIIDFGELGCEKKNCKGLKTMKRKRLSAWTNMKVKDMWKNIFWCINCSHYYAKLFPSGHNSQ